MHARVTTSQTSPEKREEAIKLIKEKVIPGAKQLPGFKGGYWFSDRATGKGFGLTLFESEEALRATEDAAAKLRAQATGTATITGVDRYEVIGHVPVQGTVGAARATISEVSPQKVDQVIKLAKETIIPSAKKLQGFKGGYWLADRKTGAGLTVTLFDNESSVRASDDSASKIRSQVSDETGAKIKSVEHYEVIGQVAVTEPAMAR